MTPRRAALLLRRRGLRSSARARPVSTSACLRRRRSIRGWLGRITIGRSQLGRCVRPGRGDGMGVLHQDGILSVGLDQADNHVVVACRG